jgi:hypothetical protein
VFTIGRSGCSPASETGVHVAPKRVFTMRRSGCSGSAETRNHDYVRKNWHKHRREQKRWAHDWYIDAYSSMSGEACRYVDERAR